MQARRQRESVLLQNKVSEDDMMTRASFLSSLKGGALDHETSDNPDDEQFFALLKLQPEDNTQTVAFLLMD